MANERRLISCCGDCVYYSRKQHKCTVCNCEESDPRNPFYDDCPLPKGVEVVRCKDCKHMEITMSTLCWCNKWERICNMDEKGYCNYGEKREVE